MSKLRQEIFESEEEFLRIIYVISEITSGTADSRHFKHEGKTDYALEVARELNLIKKTELEKAEENYRKTFLEKEFPLEIIEFIYPAKTYVELLEKELEKK